ncbi:MAG: nucleotidyltransferase domain-containing protein [Nanoarchaeota archaeon]|nr:nucleotidyltransferase domain-containing protein [Nanoarchaeota archaeon]
MNLIQFLEKNENARKIFGQRELKIIEKQLNGINLTQSEKNRLSRDIRKKFQFIKDVSKFEKEFNLKKGIENKKIIDDALEVILEQPLKNKIKKIILFGSVIENKLTVRSDIDIAVEFDKISLREATLFRKRVSGQLPDKVDIQVFNILPKKIQKEINEKGKVLYKK